MSAVSHGDKSSTLKQDPLSTAGHQRFSGQSLEMAGLSSQRLFGERSARMRCVNTAVDMPDSAAVVVHVDAC